MIWRPRANAGSGGDEEGIGMMYSESTENGRQRKESEAGNHMGNINFFLLMADEYPSELALRANILIIFIPK